MSVLIDKQAAFIALHERAESVSLKTRIGLLDAVRVIDELPPAELDLEQKILQLEEENKKLKQEVKTLYDEAAEAHELGVEQI